MNLYQASVKKPIMTALVYVAVVVIGLFLFQNFPWLISWHWWKYDYGFHYLSGWVPQTLRIISPDLLKMFWMGLVICKTYNSNSRQNYSVIYLEFEYGIDIAGATNDVRDKLDMIYSSCLMEQISLLFLNLAWKIFPLWCCPYNLMRVLMLYIKYW